MKYFKYSLMLFIICFLGLYFAYSNGYYERKNYQKMILTNEAIEKFENDIQNGINVSISDYLDEDNKYQTKTSKMALKTANKLEEYFTSSIKFIFRKISNAVE